VRSRPRVVVVQRRAQAVDRASDLAAVLEREPFAVADAPAELGRGAIGLYGQKASRQTSSPGPRARLLTDRAALS
jgi:hypothetical protein